MEHRHDRAYIRKMAKKKARRKQWISKHCLGWNCYDNLHQYSKNKIHCSCPLCAAKRRGNQVGCLSMSEQRRLESWEQALFDFKTGLY